MGDIYVDEEGREYVLETKAEREKRMTEKKEQKRKLDDEISELRARGYYNWEIAKRLGISEGRVVATLGK